MNDILKIGNIYLVIFLALFTSCSNGFKKNKNSDRKHPSVFCQPSILLKKKIYSKSDPELTYLINTTQKIDSLIFLNTAQIHKKIDTKFGKHQLYTSNKKNIKLVNEIYVKDLNIVSAKHEVFFIDDCNIIAKMTRFVFLSKRIKSVYYFIYHDRNYVGCITTSKRSLFHKSDKWVNITNEIIAKNWSSRIYNNLIKPNSF